LKHRVMPKRRMLHGVAPFTGAWIETEGRPHIRPVEEVAPFTGAWIETTDRL